LKIRTLKVTYELEECVWKSNGNAVDASHRMKQKSING
jgi:hypothetical protein